MTELIAAAKGNREIAPTMGDILDRFLRSLDITEGSKQTYRRQLRQFFAWAKESAPANPTREDILAYKRALSAKGLSALTVSGYIVAVRRFFEWAEGMGYCPNIAKGIKGAKRARGFRKDPLTVPQIKRFLPSIDRSTLQGLRDHAIANLLVRTALRTVEVIRADIADLRQESGEAVLWIQGKGRDTKDEFVLLTDESLTPILNYLRARGATDDREPLFASISNRNKGGRMTTRSVSRIVKTALRGVGLDSSRLTAHSLRHTAITLSLLGGATIQEAQRLGRHSDINTTMIYAHNINRITNAPERKIDKLLDGI